MTPPVKEEVFVDLESLAEEQLPLLKSVEDSWQPSDFLPDMVQENWREKVDELRQKAAGLSDEALVILVGNIVTEEALPSYQTRLNCSNNLRDETGASLTPWALWTRGWTAEENRHGELLSKYLYLSGRVDMRSFERTTHHLIKNGFDPKTGNDPYHAIVYVAFQERATKIAHSNVGKLAEQCGDQILSKICSAVAGDEARHEEAYKRFFRRIVEMDAAKAVIGFAEMMKQRIDMPARLMSDGTEGDLFSRFAVVAQRAGVYTLRDYAEVLRHLVEYWGIASIPGLMGEAARSQEYLCGLPEQYLAKTDRIRETLLNLPKEPFEWIFGRSA
ncbi:MAG: acyl-ACP desaturase [Candidatus Omnitrophota bacterium]